MTDDFEEKGRKVGEDGGSFDDVWLSAGVNRLDTTALAALPAPWNPFRTFSPKTDKYVFGFKGFGEDP